MGCGAIGLGVVQAIKIVQPDCEVWVLERVPSRQEFAKKLGADHVLSGEIYEATSKATGGSPVYTGMGGNRYFFGGFGPRLRLRGRRLVQPHRRAPPARPRHAGEDRPPHARRHLR